MFRRAIVIGLVVFAAACDDSPLSPSDVIGETWMLISLQQPGAALPTIVPEPPRYQVTFNDDGRAAVTSDCNSCGGSYTLTGATLAVAPLACTRAFCGDSSLDTRFTAALQQAQSIELDDDHLTIQGTAGIMRFRK